MPRRLVALGCLFATLSLGCGLWDEEPPQPPPEPMALILPTWLMGTWEMVSVVDDHQVVEVPCDGALVTVEVGDGGHISVGQGADRDDLLGTALKINEDGSLTIALDKGGRIQIDSTTEPGVVHMKGGHVLLSEGVLMASVDDAVVEHRHAPAAECGSSALQLSGLSRIAGHAFNSDGNPCMTAGLRLSTGGARPQLTRSDIAYRVVAAQPASVGTWLTVQDPDGGTHGMRVDPLDDGGVRIWQRVGEELANEVLLPVRGNCAK